MEWPDWKKWKAKSTSFCKHQALAIKRKWQSALRDPIEETLHPSEYTSVRDQFLHNILDIASTSKEPVICLNRLTDLEITTRFCPLSPHISVGPPVLVSKPAPSLSFSSPHDLQVLPLTNTSMSREASQLLGAIPKTRQTEKRRKTIADQVDSGRKRSDKPERTPDRDRLGDTQTGPRILNVRSLSLPTWEEMDDEQQKLSDDFGIWTITSTTQAEETHDQLNTPNFEPTETSLPPLLLPLSTKDQKNSLCPEELPFPLSEFFADPPLVPPRLCKELSRQQKRKGFLSGR